MQQRWWWLALAVAMAVVIAHGGKGAVEEGFMDMGQGCSWSTGRTDTRRKLKTIESMLDSVVGEGFSDKVGLCEADRSYTLNKKGIRLKIRKHAA